jgi:hypothetical protein
MGRVMRPHFAVHANDDSVKATELGHGYVDQALEMTHLAALLDVPNGEADQRRTMDYASSLDSIRRLIQRMVISALATPMDRGRRT